ncbi:hypothetical protein K6T50_17785 (plasmid) [Halobaculum magnesiiphilum]|uniref:Uncharacterized protein n=1 Tax=Halobaculum magnesiiphilum TaxID=1017351 RepID=A0A8T8WHX2_9EURY|nr:hypothetical protein [Halobaculum magnesiiphilum]QZP39437.1 hypothetical protein K6T50_17785 [Halobaculum magnesiiphilum]
MTDVPPSQLSQPIVGQPVPILIEEFEERFDLVESRTDGHGTTVRVRLDEAVLVELREVNVVHRQLEGVASRVVLQ